MKLLLSLVIGIPAAIIIVAVIYFMMMVGWILLVIFLVLLIVSSIYVGLTRVPDQTKNKSP